MNKNTEKYEIAVLVHACDRYKLLFKGFEYFFTKHWDFRIKCKLYFATEEVNCNLSEFTNIHSGKGEWSDRLKFLLQNKISEDYVLYMQEDMWISLPVNSLFFNALFYEVINKKIKQVKLHSSNIYNTMQSDIYIEGFNVSIINNDKSKYLMSHQITLWNKEFLISLLKKNEHPWRNERNGTKLIRKLNPLIYHIDYFAENGQNMINNNLNPVLRSEYYSVSENGCFNKNIKEFLKELSQSDKVGIDYFEKINFNFKNEITHDGLHKPRKIDFFKKIKMFLLHILAINKDKFEKYTV